jgi:hypothetical protein
MKNLITVIICLTFFNSNAQQTDFDLKKEYHNLLSIGVDADYVQIDIADSFPSGHVFNELVKPNWALFTLLLSNYTSIAKDTTLLSRSGDLAHLNEYVYAKMEKEDIFNRYFQLLYNNYNSHISGIENEAEDNNRLKITADSLYAVASRFFFLAPLQYTNNKYIFKACVACWDCLNRPYAEMLPIIQGVCFLAIQSSDEKGFWNDFSAARKTVLKTKISKKISAEEKTEILNNIIYTQMANSESLQKVVIAKYKELQSILNFEVE